MEPWEIMISESQERMVAVVRPEMLDAVRGVCARWELPCTAIGEVTDSGALRAFHDGEIVGEIPARLLTDECPRYEVEQHAEARPVRRPEQPEFDVGEVIEQYDHLVGSRTVRRPGLDAAVLRLRPSLRGLAVALQGPAPGEIDGFRAGRPGDPRRRAQRRVRRRRADRPHRLPQLRQPREAGDRARARAGDRGDRAGRGGARDPGRLRQRLALQRCGRRLDPADTGRRLRRARAGRAAACPAAGSSGDAVLLATSPDGSLAAEAALIRFLWKAAPHLTPLPRRRQRRHRGRARGGRGVERRPRGRRRDPGRLRLAARRGDPRLPPDAGRTRLGSRGFVRDRGGALGDVRRLRRLRPRPRRGAARRTSASSRSSTADRSRRGSRSPSTAA